MEQDTKGIRYQSQVFDKVQNLMHNVNERTLMAEHRRQEQKKATGIDGVDKAAYEVNAVENIAELVKSMKQFSYKPLPVRRTYIPKGKDKLRPLGIPAYEDRLVQGVMANVLNEVYEPRFLTCSYGFRPNRSAHDAVHYINQTIMHKKVNYILEADIKGFFDNVNHDWLMKFLEHDIQDKNFLRYIKRFLIAGIMEGGQKLESDKGTPQGGLISPILANVYLHYVLDLWMEKRIKPRLKGEVYYVRYADDFVIMFQYESEATKTLEELRKRLAEFSLEVAEDKTRILPFGRFYGTKESMDFLGFTFNNARTRKGRYRVGIRTSKKKLTAKRQAAKKWLHRQMHAPIEMTMKALAAIYRGHCNYYGVNGNIKALNDFREYLKETTKRVLNRRSQRDKLAYPKFDRIWDYFIPQPRITKDIWHWEPKVA